MFRLSILSAVLLCTAASFAQAESPLPDPIPFAVIGRPLDQIRPARPAPRKAAAAKPANAKQLATRPAPATRVARQPAATARLAPAPTQAMGASPQAAAAPKLAMAAPSQAVPGGPRMAKQALDDRADPRMRLDDVGKGTHFARKPLGVGAYLSDRHRMAVRNYYDDHPVAGTGAKWQIGEPVPQGVPVAEVPRSLLASLPPVPPGHQYLQLGGEVVLVAAGSKMVVDGVSRFAR